MNTLTSAVTLALDHDNLPGKPCYRCGVNKPLSEFTKAKRARLGRTSLCKKCANAHVAEVRVARRGERKIARPGRLLPDGSVFNRLTLLAFSHQDEAHRTYYSFRCECGKEKVMQGSPVKRGATKSCGCLQKESKAKLRLPRRTAAINYVMCVYPNGAKQRGLPWQLSPDDVAALIFAPCAYCGGTESNSYRGRFRFNGIDRVDSSLGYIPGNVVTACKFCNMAKSDRPVGDFLAWLRQAAEFHGWAK